MAAAFEPTAFESTAFELTVPTAGGAFGGSAFENTAFSVTYDGVGPAGAASFAMLLESGAKITLSWDTKIGLSWSGLEQRICRRGAPLQRYDFSTQLSDAQLRTVLSALVGNAPQAQAFLVGLTYEALTLSTNGTGATVNVWSTSSCDWAVAGQRVLVVHPDGATSAGGVVQSSSPTSLTLDVDVSAVAKAGGWIMPAQAVYLDPQQGFTRYAVNVGVWPLKATAALYGFANSMTMGVGATVNTYASMPVWDVGSVNGSTIGVPLDTGAEIVDYGGIVANNSNWTIAQWGRQLAIEGGTSDWQWFKAFLSTVRGRQVAFLAPTNNPDLLAIGDASTGTLKVDAAAGYVGTWYASLAHRKLQLLMTDGTVDYRTVEGAIDNGDGTQSLTLDSAATGTISKVSYLETCRFESDDFEITWKGPSFACSTMAHVVQR